MTPVYVWILLVQICTDVSGLQRCTGYAIDGPFPTAVECEFVAQRMHRRSLDLVCAERPT